MVVVCPQGICIPSGSVSKHNLGLSGHGVGCAWLAKRLAALGWTAEGGSVPTWAVLCPRSS